MQKKFAESSSEKDDRSIYSNKNNVIELPTFNICAQSS